MKAGIVIAALTWATLGAPEAAEARSRSNRSGFNFGSTVRVNSEQERTNAGVGSDKNTKSSSDSQLVNPYLGYSFGSLNLGMVYSGESRSQETIEVSEDGSKTKTRNSAFNGKGLSLFSRFLFADVFFFEGGAGVYQSRTTVKTEEKRDQAAGSFVGEEDSYVIKGTGLGYHVGAGIELTISNGFYFTAAYQTRIVQLRDYHGGSDLGNKLSSNQHREVLFGISYYDN